MTAAPARHPVQNASPVDPGKQRGLQRLTTDDGFFTILALDHLIAFQTLINKDRSQVTYAETVEAKLALLRIFMADASAVLLDPAFTIGPAIGAGILPSHVGLIASIEGEGYDDFVGERRTRFRSGWTTRKIRMIGADMAKLLWFYRPEASTAADQRDVVRRLVDECAGLSLPLVVEPIWYPMQGEDVTSAQWRARRVEGIIESAHLAGELGADVLKVEFPGEVATDEDRAAALDACRRLDAGVTQPWVLLSAGVGYEAFKMQVEIACRAGSAGFLGGRSIWGEAVAAQGELPRVDAARVAGERFRELVAVTRAHGRPFRPGLSGADLTAAFPAGWYEKWQA
ncbi:putative Tagatose-bisphosphate aldolase [Hyphomicrobiales bacterium]|nr:putative Tagatose-bisphosphate aldolase [Hyphomicrobiales bacterium]CAH1694898.1 putative Tagatose-bisphosphate aldolase [Hyphomicrobiales bacterium]